MKILSKNLIVIAFAIMTVLVQVNGVYASRDTNEDFCQQVQLADKNIQAKVQDRKQAFEIEKKAKKQQWQKEINTRDKALSQTRSAWDKNRQEQYNAMLHKASNEQQKNAIEQFRTTIEAAISKRRSTIDNAVSSYTQSVQSLLFASNSELDQQVQKYQQRISDATNQAKQDCAQKDSSEVVRTTLTQQLQQTKGPLDLQRNSAMTMRDQYSLTLNQPKATITQAEQEFNRTLQQALTTLKAALEQ